MIETSIFKSRFKRSDLFFTFQLKLSKEGFSIFTLRTSKKPIENRSNLCMIAAYFNLLYCTKHISINK